MNKFDIKREGRGIWYVIHTLALYATTDYLKENFIVTIQILTDHFSCDTCKVHMVDFLRTNPLKNYWHIKSPKTKEDIGFFKWSWELHNLINSKLNKPILTLDETLSTFKNYVCKNCDKIKPNPILIPIEDEEEVFTIVSR